MVRMSNDEVIAEAKKDFKPYFNGEKERHHNNEYQELLYKYYTRGFRPQLVTAINELKKEYKV